jgi:hypothetical protein
MSFPLPDPENPARSEWLDPDKQPGPRPAGEEAGLFDKILRQTTHALIAQDPLTAEEKLSFEEVAQRMRGSKAPLETVVRELVFAAIKNHISNLPGSDELGRALSQRVARTLIDDPAAKSRLETLWNRMLGGLP